MRTLIYIAKKDGIKIENVLTYEFGISKKAITRLKKYENGILVNGKHENVIYLLKMGDELCINLAEENNTNIIPQKMQLDILYEDEDILAVNKPSGMPTHPSRRHVTGTLANGVKDYYKDKDFTFRCITRLDKDTSGVVLIAKNIYAAQQLCEIMKNKEIYKEYIAVCHGKFENMKGIIDSPIKRIDKNSIKRFVDKSGKQAITKYEVTEEKDGFSKVKLNPVTGRTHQLRVHLSFIGHPICYDPIYSDDKKIGEMKLCCHKIRFINPINNKLLEITTHLTKKLSE